jgi:hypothetical protein
MRTHNTISGDSTERGNYYSLLSMSKRIIHLAGLDGIDGDTVLAVVSCMRKQPEAQLSRVAIGAKLAIRTDERKSLEKAAGRRIKRLQRGQSRIGKELIHKEAGQYDATKETSEKSTFTDNLTPAAQVALQGFWAETRTPQWAHLNREEKRARFDFHAQAALDSLPTPSPESDSEEKHGKPFSVTEYKIQFEKTLGGSIEKGFDKLLYHYGDPGAALSALQEVQSGIQRLKASLYKQVPELRRDATISSFPANGPDSIEEPMGGGEDGYIGGHEAPPGGQNVPPSLNFEEPEQMEESATIEAPGDKMSPPPSLPQWAELYLQRFGAVLLNYGLNGSGCSCENGPECKSPGKHPWGGPWKGIIRSSVGLSKGLRKLPNANLGIPTGKISGITVLDFDGPAGRVLFDDWRAEGLLSEDMLRAETGGGGIHILIQYVPGLSAKVKAEAGLDIRNDGGQIVVAPSCHRSGNVYQWANWPGTILPASPALLERLTAATATAPAVAPVLSERTHRTGTGGRWLDVYPEGTRNDATFRYACGFAGSVERIRAAAISFNNRQCQPPLDSAEVEQIVQSIAKKYPPNPDFRGKGAI